MSKEENDPQIPPTLTIPRRTDEELRKFVIDYVDHKIFVIQQIEHRKDLAPMVFVPLAAGALEGATQEVLQEIGTVYEYYDKALPRSVNGYPMFLSCRLMWIEDWKRALTAINKLLDEKAALENNIKL